MSIGREEAYAACLSTLRNTDIDRYLACLLMPEEKRGPVAALYAFNAELARVRDLVRDPLPGEIRLQWWRDLVEGRGTGDAMANPLAAGLTHVITSHQLPRKPLSSMTEARIFDLYDDPMETVGMFEGYAGETSSTLIQLTAIVLDAEKARTLTDAAGHAGIAQLVAGCLLLLPIHRRRNQLYVPLDILSATGLDRESFNSGKDRKRIGQALSAFAGFGRDHLSRARQAMSSLDPGVASKAFLPVSLAQAVFKRAEAKGAAMLEEISVSPQWLRQWRLWRSSATGRF